eukprot:151932-Chlamydomonas_euryale.AAC.1
MSGGGGKRQHEQIVSPFGPREQRVATQNHCMPVCGEMSFYISLSSLPHDRFSLELAPFFLVSGINVAARVRLLCQQQEQAKQSHARKSLCVLGSIKQA